MPNGTRVAKARNPIVGQRGNVMTTILKLRHLSMRFGTCCIVFPETLQFAVFWNNLKLIFYLCGLTFSMALTNIILF